MAANLASLTIAWTIVGLAMVVVTRTATITDPSATSNPESFLSMPMYFHASMSSSSSYDTHHLHIQQRPQRGHPHPPTPTPSNSRNDTNGGMFELLLLSTGATIGSIGSILVVSTLTVLETYQTRGNCLLVSFTLSHLLVTVFVLPASCVAIMAGAPDQPVLCHYQWLAIEATFLISVLSLTFMAIENFKGLRSVVTYDLCCTKFRVVSISLIIWFASIGIVVAQHVHDWGPHFCPHKRSLPIWLPYHASLAAGLILLPTLVSVWYFTRAFFSMKNYRLAIDENPQAQIYFLTDEGILNSNVAVYAAFVLMWGPLVIVVILVGADQQVSQTVIEYVVVCAIANSCFYSYLYAFTNRDMAETFIKLLYYCCCKSHVSFVRKQSPGFNLYSQQQRSQTAVMSCSPVLGSSRYMGMGAYANGANRSMAMGQISGAGMMGGGPFRNFRTNNMSSAL